MNTLRLAPILQVGDAPPLGAHDVRVPGRGEEGVAVVEHSGPAAARQHDLPVGLQK